MMTYLPAASPKSLVARLLESPWTISALGLAVVLAFHSPRWWLIAAEAPGSLEWNRALSYLKQCENPFRTDIEPAMQWRFFPQLFVYGLGGHRWIAVAIPWVGAWVLLTYIASLMRRSGFDLKTAFYATVLLGSYSPILASTGWVGINDSWFVLGLCYLAFGRNRVLICLACAICPFIDERFVFGAACAIALRNIEGLKSSLRVSIPAILLQLTCSIAPYIFTRVLLQSIGSHDDVSFRLLRDTAYDSRTYLWYFPMALWMAYRGGFYSLGVAMTNFSKCSKGATATLLLFAFIPIIAGAPLASDMSRTAAIAFPLFAWAICSKWASCDSRSLRLIAISNLLIPAAHVTYTKVVPINSLIVEGSRLLR